MLLIRQVKTEKYICVINEQVAISVDLKDTECPPTQFSTIEDARKCIETLRKDTQW